MQKSPKGKFLLNYVIDSKDELNLLEFIKPKLASDSVYQISKSFQIFKNAQFKKITGKSLFEHHLEICIREVLEPEKVDRKLKFQFFTILLSLLEEIEIVRDIKTELPIDKLLDYANTEVDTPPNTSTNEPVSGVDYANDKKFYSKILDGRITAEELKNHEKTLKSKIYFVDDLLANIMVYWTHSDTNYNDYKEKFKKLGTHFEMLIDIIEGNDKKLVDNFLENMKKLEKYFHVRYQKDEYDPNDVTGFLTTLLFASVRHGRKVVIDCIFKYENFIRTDFQFPPNMRCDKMTRYLAKKFLHNGIELGRGLIPENWLLPEDFEDFLNTRINYNNKNLVEIDTSFMIHRVSRKQQIESNEDVDYDQMLWEDTRSLKYIIENKLLREFVMHPVISTYIDLKTVKLKQILLWNFYIFLGLIILPFAGIIAYSSYNSSSKIWNLILIPVSVLALREYFQFTSVDESWKNYRKKISNLIEITLIFTLTLTWILSLTETKQTADFINLYIKDYIILFAIEDFIKFLKIASIFLITGSFLLTLPFGSMQVNIAMIKQVAKNFLKFFFAMCFSVLFAYAISFRLIFSNGSDKNLDEVSDEFTTLKPETDEANNFERIDSALLKVVMMLSGEFGTEPVKLTFCQILLFATFVLTSFILFNLILGMAIDDVQNIRSEARKLTLTENARKFIEIHEKCYKLYADLRLDIFDYSELSCFKKLKVLILRRGLSTYPFIHKLDKFYVNLKSHEITVAINGVQEKLINECIHNDAFEKIKEILKERNRILTKNCKNNIDNRTIN